MKYYGGIDLHSNNMVLIIIDEQDKVLYEKRLPNAMQSALDALLPYKQHIAGLVVESTYNWYWLVDGLQDNGFAVHLANTAAIKVYEGLKHTNDATDAFWLAHVLRLGLLPEGYIYPKEERGLRELLRQRLHLVREQTRIVLTIQGTLMRYENIKLSGNKIKTGTEEKLLSSIKDAHVKLAVCSRFKVLNAVMEQIMLLEATIIKSLKGNGVYKLLKTVPGIGVILAMTILLETGEVGRFTDVGNYSSYCRCVGSKKISNGKKKGENNRKNGNPYLAWAFMEAAHHAIRAYPAVTKFYQKQLAKKHQMVAFKAVASKLARAAYFVLRDQVPFEMRKLFMD